MMCASPMVKSSSDRSGLQTDPDVQRSGVYVDGSGKSGVYCYLDSGGKAKIFVEPPLTNNQAEYRAIIAALQGVSGVKLTIYSDSQLAVRQLSGEYEIRDPKLKILAAKVQQLCQNREVTFRWIPREKNLAGKILEKLV